MGAELSVLSRAALACRIGLSSLSTSSTSLFSGFPRGACGPASEVLGRLLRDEFGLDGFYVCGRGHRRLKRDQSHAWVEVDGFILDITHDQFTKTGLVGWVVPQNSSWHAAFRDVTRRSGFCTPSGWPMYPHDGYAAARIALAARP